MLTSSMRQVLPAAAAILLLVVGVSLIRVVATDKLLTVELAPADTRLSNAIAAELGKSSSKIWTATWQNLNEKYGATLRPQDVSSLTTSVRDEIRTHGFKAAADALAKQTMDLAPHQSDGDAPLNAERIGKLFEAAKPKLNVSVAAEAAIAAIEPDVIQKTIDSAQPRKQPAQDAAPAQVLAESVIVLDAKGPVSVALQSVIATPADVSKRMRLAEDPLALPASDAARIATRFKPRVIWAGATLVFFALIGASLAVSVSVIRLNAKDHSSVILGIAIAVLVISFTYGLMGSKSMGPPLLNTLLNSMSPGSATVFDRLSSVMNALALGASAFLLAAACTSLAGTLDRDLIMKRVERLGWILSVGAALLVAGVIEIGALYRLPASMMTEADSRTHVEAIATTAATGAAVLFTALLLAVYLPALGLLRLRAEQTASGNESAAMTEIKWLRRIAAVAQLFAPILVGLPLDKLLGVVMQLTGSSGGAN